MCVSDTSTNGGDIIKSEKVLLYNGRLHTKCIIRQNFATWKSAISH